MTSARGSIASPPTPSSSTEEYFWGHAQGTDARTTGLGLEAARTFPATVNTCLLRVSRCHLPLVEHWRRILASDEYLSVIWEPATQRPLHYGSDLHVFTGLLGSTLYADVPVVQLRRGAEIAQCYGPRGGRSPSGGAPAASFPSSCTRWARSRGSRPRPGPAAPSGTGPRSARGRPPGPDALRRDGRGATEAASSATTPGSSPEPAPRASCSGSTGPRPCRSFPWRWSTPRNDASAAGWRSARWGHGTRKQPSDRRRVDRDVTRRGRRASGRGGACRARGAGSGRRRGGPSRRGRATSCHPGRTR